MVTNPTYQLILASKSPRRREFLAWSGLPFTIMSSGIEEVTTETEPHLIVTDLAQQKGHYIFQQLKKESTFNKTLFPFVLSADTLVFLDEHVLGTPHSLEEAKKMLSQLSGQTHQVLTGVSFLAQDWNKGFRSHSFFVQSEVTFAPIDEDLLEQYLQTHDPLDKAGAYGIQGPALTFIRTIQGSYSNIAGLPIHELIVELKKFLGKERDQKGEWKKMFMPTDCLKSKSVSV